VVLDLVEAFDLVDRIELEVDLVELVVDLFEEELDLLDDVIFLDEELDFVDVEKSILEEDVSVVFLVEEDTLDVWQTVLCFGSVFTPPSRSAPP
jgi:hypothetical protein